MRPRRCPLSPEPSPKHPASLLSPGVLAGSWSLPPQPLGGLRSGYVLTKVANEEQARRAAGRWRQGSGEPGPGPLPSLKAVAPGVGEGCGWPPPHLCAPLGFSRPVWVGAACPAPGPPSPLLPPALPPQSLLADLVLYQAVLTRLEIRVVHAIGGDELLVLRPLLLRLGRFTLRGGVLQHLGDVLLLGQKGGDSRKTVSTGSCETSLHCARKRLSIKEPEDGYNSSPSSGERHLPPTPVGRLWVLPQKGEKQGEKVSGCCLPLS